MTKSMTEGRPLPLILRFALPLLIGSLLQQTYSMIDAAIVGRYLGVSALAGVGASSSVQFLVIGFCMGTCAGFGVPIARHFGAGEHGQMRSDVFHGAILTAGMAVVITVFCALFCHQILHILRTPDDIYENAYRYLLVIFLGIPCTLLYNYLSCILRAVGDSRTPFLFLAVATGLNIILDLFCIIILGWGCAGAGIATVAAQAFSGLGCLLYMRKHHKMLYQQSEPYRFERSRALKMMGMAVPMGLQFSITAIGSMVMQSANNSLGSVYVSGFTAGAKIKAFLMAPFDSIATGVSVFCSQNLGARKPDRIRKGLFQGVLAATIYGAAAGLIMICFGKPLSGIFIGGGSENVLNASAKYVASLGLFYWALGPLNTCRLSTQGLGFSGRAIFSGVSEMIARVAVSFLFVGHYGYTAICFADPVAWIAGSLYIVPTCIWAVRTVTARVH